MSDFVKFSIPTMFHETTQSLLEARRLARSLENIVDALIPLTTNTEAVKQLEKIRETSAFAAHALQRLYNRNAKEAFGASPIEPSPRGGSSNSDVSEGPSSPSYK